MAIIPAITSDDKFQSLEKWLRRFSDSEDFYESFFDDGEENYRMFKAYTESGENKYKHQIFVPYSFAYVEDLTAALLLSIYASPVIWSLTPWWTSVSVDLCRELEQLLQWVVTNEESEFALELEELLKMVNIFNAGYLINYPVTREDTTGSGTTATKRESFDRLHLDIPHTHDVFPEPGPKRLSRSGWVIKRGWDNIDNIKKMAEEGVYSDVEEIEQATNEQSPAIKMLESIGYEAIPFNRDRIELLDCMEDGDIFTIANKSVVIRDTKKSSPDLRAFLFQFPMLDLRLNGAPGEFFGIGVLEGIKPLQKELNTLRSQRRDNISLILNKLFIYDMLAGEVDLNTLISAPGNIIVTNNRNCIDEFPISDVTASSYKEEQSITSDMQNVSALHDYARGIAPRRKETATGIIRLQQAAQARSEWMLKKVDEYILLPLCRRILVYLRQYLSPYDYDNIIGPNNKKEEFFNLNPMDLKRCFRVRPLTESITSTKEIDMNQFMMAFDRLIRMPPQMINHVGLIKQLLQKLGQRNIKEILPLLSREGQEMVQMGMPGAQAAMQGGPPGGAQMPAPGKVQG